MSLKGKKPEEVKIGKPKFFISGNAKVGKTMFSLNFPKPYLFDTEGGAVLPQYVKALKKVEGAYFGKEEGSQDFEEVLKEIKELATTKHSYKTLIIDSFSYLYLLEAAEAEEKLGSDYGRDKKEANKPTRKLIRILEKIDMTVILVCHSKDKWEKKKGTDERVNTGTTFDGWDKMEYIYDLWLEILPDGKNMLVKGSRFEQFPKGEIFPATYEQFSEMYGRDILEKESKPIVFATKEQLGKLEHLLINLNVDQSSKDKWFKKFNVESFEEMTTEDVDKIIELLHKRIMQLNMEETNGKKKS